MDIGFRTPRLAKQFAAGRKLQALHGERRARL